MTDGRFAALARLLGGRAIHHGRLVGGVSAVVDRLDVLYSDGTTERVVVRRHDTTGNKPLDAGVTAREHDLLAALCSLGLPVPKPRLLDTSCAVFPTPFIVVSFVDGTSDVPPHSVHAALEAMADFLAGLHGLDPASLGLPELARRDDPVPELLEYLPSDVNYLRDELQRRPGAWRSAESTLLHGDFWPGNVLWDGERIAAVIDWEDAALGDPLSDLAGCRQELLWRYGADAAEAFTAHYLARRPGTLDPTRLALWELLAGAAALHFMGRWGLEPAVEARMRAQTAEVLRAAAVRFGSRLSR